MMIYEAKHLDEIIYNEVINEAAYKEQDVSAGHDSPSRNHLLSLKSGSSFIQSVPAGH